MKHHYVPQFLLRAWANGLQDKKVEIFRLDLEGFPSSRRAPKSTAYENNLYALSKQNVAGMEQQDIENKVLMQVDNLAARTHQKLVEHGLQSLTNDERCAWVIFLMFLRVRQPDCIQQLITKSAEHLGKELDQQPEEYDEIAKSDDPPTLVECTERLFPGLIENFGLKLFPTIATNPEIGMKIFKMKWWLWDFADIPFDLLLADHPCIFTKGIDDPNLIIALPVSPKKAFMATNSEDVAAMMRRQNPKHLAMRLNESSLNQARARIYARNTSPMRFIQNRAGALGI